ncbi:SPOR domain-containing protein [Paracoccus spongiarum]|uniref:SPOR domain-containing protein n=1 Tax=Paracoccus spongiarum TaxID=3064387 RepID=A0ABT9J9T7_9RHOB|nr:SPOR domain-containing protein [Paracoccus sp. 2205BS29-5]MDP5306409.1 SPOR domain-containing protein [Paracoccus sp. 2205BS29-5]
MAIRKIRGWVMRLSWSVFGFVVLSGAAGAAPVPAPPEGFAGLQYVDGRGCVWQKSGFDWTARLDAAGVAVCGFPPTASARRTDPALDRVLAPEHPAQAASAEDLLVEQLASGLRQGEFRADPRPPEPRAAPPAATAPDPLATSLKGLAEREALLRSALSGGERAGSGLCARLGYVPADSPIPVIGGDVTQGLCPGMRAPRPEERITAGFAGDTRPRAAAAAAGAAAPPAGPATAAARTVVPSPAAGSVATRAAPSVAGRGARATNSIIARRGQPGPKAVDETVEMIPASARYVQVGSFADDANATVVIRRLSSMGFRVAQQRIRKGDGPARTILAGPFTDRRALVAALDRLRRQGYPRAVAR